MPHGVHKTGSVSWHPKDPTLKPWLEAEASSRGTTKSEILDEALADYRERVEFARSVSARTANAEIGAALREARTPLATETTQANGEPR